MSEAWPEWAVDVVKVGWERGDSASRIAADLGHRWSRNSIIGKAHRLKLPGRAPTPQPRAQRARPQKVAAARVPKLHHAVGNAPVKPTPPPRIKDSAIPLAQRKQLIDLGPRDCRWPCGDVGEPGFFFCGAGALEGAPYCGAHCKRAYAGFPSRRM